jgi:hypothetical protein
VFEQQSNGRSNYIYTTARNMNSKNSYWWASFTFKNEELTNTKTKRVIDAGNASGNTREGARVYANGRNNSTQ